MYQSATLLLGIFAPEQTDSRCPPNSWGDGTAGMNRSSRRPDRTSAGREKRPTPDRARYRRLEGPAEKKPKKFINSAP